MTEQYIDWAGQPLTVPRAAEGPCTATWSDGKGEEILDSPAWRYGDGTLFIPADAQGSSGSIDETGRAIGQWVEATTGLPAVIFGGAPRLLEGLC